VAANSRCVRKNAAGCLLLILRTGEKGSVYELQKEVYLTTAVVIKLGKRKQVICGILAASDFSGGSDANVLQTRSLSATDVVRGVSCGQEYASQIGECHKKSEKRCLFAHSG